jgi:cytidylate kinase
MKTADASRVIAIDGPAASGKSTVAREVAKRIGFDYLNSGAMYRAVTWHVLQSSTAPEDETAITNLLESSRIDCIPSNLGAQILINGIDPEKYLREDRVNETVSLVSRYGRVRQILVEKMLNYVRDRDVVIEGRDIGSVVFPETPYKYYIDASPEVRARRRMAQGQTDHVEARDSADSSRTIAPLTVAPDAHFIDTSHLTIQQVVDQILGQLKTQGMKI